MNPLLSQFDGYRPWNSVLLAGLRGVDALQFWEDNLKEPARMWMRSPRSVTHPSWVNRQQNLYVPEGAAPSVRGISLRQPGQPVSPRRR